MESSTQEVAVLDAVLMHAKAYIGSLQTAKVSSGLTVEELRTRFAQNLPVEEADPCDVIEQLVSDASGGILGNAGGRRG
jgi:hypothetical protein